MDVVKLIIDILSGGLILIGAGFFLAGTVGLLRFPDLFSRVHALTKADNLGLGFIVAGLLLQSPNVFAGLKLIVIWLLALFAAATAAYLVAHQEHVTTNPRVRPPHIPVEEEERQ